MVRDGHVHHLDGLDAALLDQAVHELAVVQHLVVAAELGILVLDGVETVGADGDDGLDVVAVHHLDVLLGQHLVQVLVAHAAGRVAGAGFLLAQDGEIDAGGLEHFDHGAGDALAALLQRGGAAHPEQDLRIRLFGDGGHVQALSPVGAGECGAAPRVAALLHAEQGVHTGFGDARLLEDEAAAHVHDGGHVLDDDGAFLHAGAAGHAVPDGLLGNRAVDQRHGFHVLGIAGALVADGDHVLLEVLDDVHGGENLAGGVGRAGVGAASAYGAGVAVQQLAPGEVLDAGRAEADVLVHVVQVDEGDLQTAAGLQVAEESVDGRGDHVDVLGEGDVEGEAQDDEQVHPPEDGLQHASRAGGHAGRAEPAADCAADEYCRLGAVAVSSDVEGVDQQGGDHEAGGEADNDDGLALASQVETEAMGLRDPAAEEGPDQGGQHHDGQDIQVDAVHQHAGGGKDCLTQRVPDRSAEDEDQVGQAEGQESPEDGGVADAGQVDAAGTGIGASDALQHLALSQDDGGRSDQTGQRAVEARGGRALQHQPEHAVVHGVTGDGKGDGGQNVDAHPNGQDAEKSIGGNHRQPCSGMAGLRSGGPT